MEAELAEFGETLAERGLAGPRRATNGHDNGAYELPAAHLAGATVRSPARHGRSPLAGQDGAMQPGRGGACGPIHARPVGPAATCAGPQPIRCPVCTRLHGRRCDESGGVDVTFINGATDCLRRVMSVPSVDRLSAADVLKIPHLAPTCLPRRPSASRGSSASATTNRGN